MVRCAEVEVAAATAVRARKAPVSRRRVERKEPESFAGLCSNCGVRQTCILPKSGGGVLYCEEYQ